MSGIKLELYNQLLEKRNNLINQHNDIIKLKKLDWGIIYTPENIAKMMVKMIMEEKLKNMPFEEIENIKILDPCCGEGIFLIEMYKYLLDYYKSKNIELNYDKRCDILLNNLYGIDIDELAVEITKLNLCLILISDNYNEMQLPDLSYNIKCGNFLLDNIFNYEI